MPRHLSRKGPSFVGALALFVASATAGRAAPTEAEGVVVGPWKVEAALRNGKFMHCVMSRTTTEGVEVSILRDTKGVELRMASPKWRLGRGKSYPVDLAAGSLVLEANVSATGDSVAVRLTDDQFIKQLGVANELDVKGAGSTIHVALDQSAAGLERLDTCFDKNATSSTEANPFVAPKQKP